MKKKQKQVVRKIQTGQTPSRPEMILVNFAEDSVKDNLTVMNSLNEKLFSFSMAFSGGSLVLLDRFIQNIWLKNLVTLCFMLALFVSFWGLIPYSENVNSSAPDEIKNYIDKALKHKAFTVKLSFGIIALALSGVILFQAAGI